uniref:Uncharacterized protein n=1 Tax=Salix viminalis TaxID=40686 RepID=A0A6N2NAZ4_SALVM
MVCLKSMQVCEWDDMLIFTILYANVSMIPHHKQSISVAGPELKEWSKTRLEHVLLLMNHATNPWRLGAPISSQLDNVDNNVQQSMKVIVGGIRNENSKLKAFR